MKKILTLTLLLSVLLPARAQKYEGVVEKTVALIGNDIVMLSDIEAADLSNMTVVFTDTDGIEYVSTPSAADDALYDLQGRKLNSVPQHGVYIKNGKKYVK